MGSVGNQNPLSPYDNYRDCSLGVCSIYCPQFCYLIFPPPPPSDDDSGSPFSPLIIAIIGVLASAFLLVSYYTIVTKYCKGRRRSNQVSETEENLHEVAHQQQQWEQIGLDEALIDKITVCKYRNGDGLIEGTDCAVCLSEFQENESLRLLPKCSHAFHLPCIDAWLKSHSNCPLCRANVVALASPPLNLSSYQVNPPGGDDLVLVVESDFREQVVVISDDVVDEGLAGGDTVISTSPQRQQQLLISDILKFEEIEEYVRVEIDEQLWRRGIGSSKEENDRSGGKLLRSPMAATRRSGRFVGRVNDKGKNAVLSSIP